MRTDALRRLRVRGSNNLAVETIVRQKSMDQHRCIRQAAGWGFFRLCFTFCIALLTLTHIAVAGSVQTKDGNEIHGDLHLDTNSISVHSSDNQDAQFTLDEILQINFAADPAEALTNAPGSGGLKGEYFLGTSFEAGKRKLLRLDPTINFTWKFGRDAVLMPNEWTWVPFCVRWTGQIRPLFTENYTLRIRDPLPDGGDIHGHLWIDRKLLIDDNTDSGEIHFEAGHLYDLRFESIVSRADHRGKPSLARLTWESQNQRRQIVPANCLYTSPNAPDAPVVSRLTSLPRESMVFAPTDISITAEVEHGHRDLDRVDLCADGTVLKIFQTAPCQFTWVKPPPGDYQIGVIPLTKDGGKWPSGHARVIVADNDNGKIPKPWARSNIGDGGPEPASVSDQKITLGRSGGELYAKQDKFQFVYQMLTGDGEITAKLTDLSSDAPNTQPVAGLMLRRSLMNNSRGCAVLIQPNVGTVFWNRGFEGEANLNAPSATSTSGFLRLVRDGSDIRTYRSNDGLVWQFVDQKELDLPATMLVGVAVSAQSTGHATAAFDNVAVTSTGLHDYSENGSGVLFTDGSQLNGDVTTIEKGVVTLERGEKKNRHTITIDLKSIARINFHRTEIPIADQPDPAWRGAILSHGDLFEGDITIRNARDIRINSDVFGPRTFNGQNELAALMLASVQPQPAGYSLLLSDGSTLHCSKVEFTANGIDADTIFAKGFHLDITDLSQLIMNTR